RGQRGGNRTYQDIAVDNVRQLVAQNPLKFLPSAKPHDSSGYRDRRVFWIAASGKRVRSITVDQVEPRHRDTRVLRQLMNDRVELGSIILVERPSTVGSEHHLVGKPVA